MTISKGKNFSKSLILGTCIIYLHFTYFKDQVGLKNILTDF